MASLYAEPEPVVNGSAENIINEEASEFTDIMRARGYVKWFDCHRGFGFVVPDDGAGIGGSDILVHWTVLEPLGRRDLPENAVVECEYADAPKGLQATKILNVDETGCDQPQSTSQTGLKRSAMHVVDDETSAFADAEVKWFNRAKGYGFLIVNDIDSDVFIHMETLRDAGLGEIIPGQHLLVRTTQGDRGHLAVQVNVPPQ